LIELQDPLRTWFGTLKVVAGNISVHSRNAMGLDADVDIDLDSNTGERISGIGHWPSDIVYLLRARRHLGVDGSNRPSRARRSTPRSRR
jgi:hypothetical protein